MANAQTALVKYVYLDIVGFTHDRSVEAQSDIIAKMNSSVKEAVGQHHIPKNKLIYLPTGDGLCIALVDVSNAYDLHLQVALTLLRLISEHNEKTVDAKRQIAIRVGLNENVDNLIVDIKGNRNVAGYGVSMAHRIMDKADGGQILVGTPVYEQLGVRESYLESFRMYQTTVKHGIPLSVYQYVRPSPGLNVEIPSSLRQMVNAEPPSLTRWQAYYLAYALKNRELFISKKNVSLMEQGAMVMLYYLASDAETKSETHELKTPTHYTWGAGKNVTVEEQFNHYQSIDFPLIWDFAMLIRDNSLLGLRDYFEPVDDVFPCVFVSKEGIQKLQQDYPDICIELEIQQ